MRAWLCDAETLEPYLSLAVNAAVGAKLKIMPILVGALQQGQMRGWKCFRFLDASMDTINPLPEKGHFKRDYHRPKTSFLLETYFRMNG